MAGLSWNVNPEGDSAKRGELGNFGETNRNIAFVRKSTTHLQRVVGGRYESDGAITLEQKILYQG